MMGGRAVLAHEIAGYRAALAALPRVSLAHLPTPLDSCPRLSERLGGPVIMVKRDDCTGLAFGGNKVRQHEYVLGAALAEGADCLIQGAAAQSNHSRQLAAAGAKLGLETFLLPQHDPQGPVQGNLLIDHVLGATVLPRERGESATDAKAELASRLRAAGRRPYVTGMNAEETLVLAAVAYVDALFEIVECLPDGQAPDWIYTASQGSTQAGLLIGCEILGLPTKVLGVNPMTEEHEAFISRAGILELAHQAGSLLGFNSRLTDEDILTTTEFVGDGYGVPSPAGLEAIRTLASTEGILLDPVYSGKAFAAILAHCANGSLQAGQRVVFLHTGGVPALFAFGDVLIREP